jgi:hypothetical protein
MGVRKGRLRVRKGSIRDMNIVLERGITLEAEKLNNGLVIQKYYRNT